LDIALAIKAKMLILVLPIEKRLVVSFWTFFKHLAWQPRRITVEKKNETTKNFCWCRSIFL